MSGMQRSFAVFASVTIALAACSSAGGNAPSAFSDGVAGSQSSAGASGIVGKGGSTGTGGGGIVGSTGGGGSTGSDACGDVGKRVYVVSSNDELVAFDPQALSFALIGKVSCPSAGHPFSMAVDRTGLAFVLYDDGNIFWVSTVDASCKPSGYVPGQLGFNQFGMGYVSDAAGSTSETLYVIDDGAQGLGLIDSAGKVMKVGQFDKLAAKSGEVTGTGDGRLFGFFVDITNAANTSVAEIDTSNAKVISNVTQSLPPINAWAFAHWGGSFYLFDGTGTENSRVDKFTPGKGTTKVVANAGYRIVGAGVSTCAPTKEPNPQLPNVRGDVRATTRARRPASSSGRRRRASRST